MMKHCCELMVNHHAAMN